MNRFGDALESSESGRSKCGMTALKEQTKSERGHATVCWRRFALDNTYSGERNLHHHHQTINPQISEQKIELSCYRPQGNVDNTSKRPYAFTDQYIWNDSLRPPRGPLLC